jgi:hypothetical protein
MNWKLFWILLAGVVLYVVAIWSYHSKTCPDRYSGYVDLPRILEPLQIPSIQHVVYINLAKRLDRKNAVEQEVRQLDWAPVRIDAVEHHIGPMGCSLSHIRALEYAQSQQWPHVLICEDDLQFRRSPREIQAQLKVLLEHETKWDVVLFGAHVHRVQKRSWKGCVRVLEGNLAHCYLVRRAYYPTLLHNFRAGMERYQNHPTENLKYALDIFWCSLQERDQWLMPVPILAYQRSSYSNNVHTQVEHTDSIDQALESALRQQA